MSQWAVAPLLVLSSKECWCLAQWDGRTLLKPRHTKSGNTCWNSPRSKNTWWSRQCSALYCELPATTIEWCIEKWQCIQLWVSGPWSNSALATAERKWWRRWWDTVHRRSDMQFAKKTSGKVWAQWWSGCWWSKTSLSPPAQMKETVSSKPAKLLRSTSLRI